MITDIEITRAMAQSFNESSLPLPGRSTGKVRDWYTLPGGRRLIVTTDRLSAFDRILAAVPYKGQVLNQLAAWWFEQTHDLVPNHILSIPDPNAALVLEADPIPVEVVVRGYITGVTGTALWHRYSLGEREIYGYRFGPGLRKNQALPEAIITPTTKGGPTGHDERLTCQEVVEKGILDEDTWAQVQAAALSLFQRGQETARKSGVILVDTKYEFGRAPDGRILVIDEIHTPDSSRFWKEDTYRARFEAGEEPDYYDKEFIRLHYAGLGYRGDGPLPEVDPGLWVQASRFYIQAFELLTGQVFQPGAYPVNDRLIGNLRRKGLLQ